MNLIYIFKVVLSKPDFLYRKAETTLGRGVQEEMGQKREHEKVENELNPHTLNSK